MRCGPTAKPGLSSHTQDRQSECLAVCSQRHKPGMRLTGCGWSEGMGVVLRKGPRVCSGCRAAGWGGPGTWHSQELADWRLPKGTQAEHD